jgi:hypothetical protein
METTKNTPTTSSWKTKFSVSVLLLALSFVGIIITDLRPSSAWTYWNIMIPLFAILCLWLSWLDSKEKERITGITLLHEFLHWIATLATVYIVALFVKFGVVSDVVAGLFVLILLALSTFLAGIYIEKTFLLIGLMLGLFAIISVLFLKYLLIITIPLSILVLVILLWMYKRKSKN